MRKIKRERWGRDGRREEKGKEGGNLLSVPAKCQQTNLGPSSVCIHKLAGIIWSNDLLLVAYSTCIPSLSKSLFHMPFRWDVPVGILFLSAGYSKEEQDWMMIEGMWKGNELHSKILAHSVVLQATCKSPLVVTPNQT